MTTLQADFEQLPQPAANAPDHGRFWANARTALGIALVFALLLAGLALRVLVYVRLS